MVFYCPDKGSRGWWLREYHSAVAMRKHLAGKEGWGESFSDEGPYRSERAAVAVAENLLAIVRENLTPNGAGPSRRCSPAFRFAGLCRA